MAVPITEITVKGKTWFISSYSSDTDDDSLYYGSERGRGMHECPFSWVLRKGEIVDRWSYTRISKYDIGEWISSQW